MRGQVLAVDFEKRRLNNVTVKWPGNGISPMRIDEVIGQSAKRAFDLDELIEI